MATEGGRQTTEERRQQRHESRANQTWKAFVADLCAMTNLDEENATRAATSVLCHLEQRLTPEEAQDLLAQLPVKLCDLLDESCSLGGDVHKLHREDFIACVADDLGLPAPESEVLVRAVFATVRAHVSDGEAADVAAQLPRDLEPLWARPV